jgi:site-specific DNA-methyltransferase (adenine-specific)
MTKPYWSDSTVQLHLGDCLGVLAGMETASADAIVTDPPAAVSFMGREWDSDMGGRAQWVAWLSERMAQAVRVLRPGGHALVWSLPRTAHWTAWALEDAGLQIRDCIPHLFGCLSDDTEILTSEGWVRYDRAQEGQHVAAIDPRSGALQWEPVSRVWRYWHDGEMVSLKSDATDQLLTPNHRVLLEADRQAPHTPYVASGEDLRRLLGDVPGRDAVSVGAEQDVLEGMLEGVTVGAPPGHAQTAGGARWPLGAVRGVRDADMAAGCSPSQGHPAGLLPHLQRGVPRSGVGHARSQGPVGLGTGNPGGGQREDDRSAQPGVEGRRYRFQEARELCRGPVRQGAGMGAPDGTQGRLHHGAPAPDGGPVRLPADPYRSDQPREPRSVGQSPGEPDALAGQQQPQALRARELHGRGFLPCTAVTASRVVYAGVVWCVTVPSGAFIARRNGLIFATGNSGFPKSLDVGKAIDRSAGAEREVIGQGKFASRRPRADHAAQGLTFADDQYVRPAGHDLTAPATEDAARWDGWGTALKPGQELWWLARKPIRGTVAASVLEHGTGALNIDGCRVGVDPTTRSRTASDFGLINDDGWQPTPGVNGSAAGRWPPNLVLTHSQCCTEDACAGDCPVGELDRQSGHTASVFRRPTGGAMFGKTVSGSQDGGTIADTLTRGHDDAGGASRFYPVFRYQAKAPAAERPRLDDGTAHPTVKPLGLMCWLARLITPPGGTILDLFAGTGVTAEAAIIEGFRCILIEADPASAELIRIRLRKDIQPAMFA